MSLLAVLGVFWALSLTYVGWIHIRAARERRRRHATGVARVAVRVWPPHDPGALTLRYDAALLGRWLAGLATDRPRAVPLIAAIIASGGTAFLLADPLMDEPLLWARSPQGISVSALPQPVRVALGVLILIAALVHVVWVFFAAPLTLSWQKLVLEPGGRVRLDGCDMPEVDPARASFVSLSVPSAHGAPATGMTLEQDGRHYAFDYLGLPDGNLMGPVPSVPHDWWHLTLEGEVARVDTFLQRHYGPGSAPFARITPMPGGDS